MYNRGVATLESCSFESNTALTGAEMYFDAGSQTSTIDCTSVLSSAKALYMTRATVRVRGCTVNATVENGKIGAVAVLASDTSLVVMQSRFGLQDMTMQLDGIIGLQTSIFEGEGRVLILGTLEEAAVRACVCACVCLRVPACACV